MNYIQVLFSFFSSFIIISGSLINLFEDQLPLFFRQIFKYGKFSEKSKIRNFLVIEVPKAWFKHFYVATLPIYVYVFYVVNRVYVFQRQPPIWLENFLDLVCGDDRISHTPAIKVYIATTLLTLQVARRFYDTHFVSVFGKKSYMNVSHYIVGLLHYPITVLAILCEAPYFARFSAFSEPELNLSSITLYDVVAILLFLYAWWHQHVCSKILANLRKNENGEVVTDEHKIPHGDWFKFVSCPHQTAEILMYLSVTIILSQNITWFFVFVWVLVNQVETILLSHWWYQQAFDNFPETRKALIPWVY